MILALGVLADLLADLRDNRFGEAEQIAEVMYQRLGPEHLLAKLATTFLLASEGNSLTIPSHIRGSLGVRGV